MHPPFHVCDGKCKFSPHAENGERVVTGYCMKCELEKEEKMGLEVQSSVAAEIWVNGTKLTVGWDNWSGLFIMAWDTDGDRIVREIARFTEI